MEKRIRVFYGFEELARCCIMEDDGTRNGRRKSVRSRGMTWLYRNFGRLYIYKTDVKRERERERTVYDSHKIIAPWLTFPFWFYYFATEENIISDKIGYSLIFNVKLCTLFRQIFNAFFRRIAYINRKYNKSIIELQAIIRNYSTKSLALNNNVVKSRERPLHIIRELIRELITE